MSYETLSIGVVKTIAALFKSFFWKNKKAIYINSNKKMFPVSKIKKNIKTNENNPKLLSCQDKIKDYTVFPKRHFLKQKICLYQIHRNMKDECEITYGGFASPPLVAFDGCALNNAQSYSFVDFDNSNSNPYTSTFKPKTIKIKESFNLNSKINEAALFIDPTKKIKETLNPRIPITKLEYRVNKINKEYLNYVYNFVYKYLDQCLKHKIKKVHLYIAAKQPVSFVVGVAVQPCHPNVIAYEFYSGEYVWGLNIKTGETCTYAPYNSIK